jgi:hypothetical protein
MQQGPADSEVGDDRCNGCARNEGHIAARGTLESGVRRAQSGRAHSTTAITAITSHNARILRSIKKNRWKKICLVVCGFSVKGVLCVLTPALYVNIGVMKDYNSTTVPWQWPII